MCTYVNPIEASLLINGQPFQVEPPHPVESAEHKAGQRRIQVAFDKLRMLFAALLNLTCKVGSPECEGEKRDIVERFREALDVQGKKQSFLSYGWEQIVIMRNSIDPNNH